MLLQPPKYFEEKEKIIYSVAWATDNEISLTWESRHQNYSLVSICDTGAACRDSLVMTEPNGWMDLDHPPLFTKGQLISKCPYKKSVLSKIPTKNFPRFLP